MGTVRAVQWMREKEELRRENERLKASLSSMTERCKELEEALGRCDELFALIRCDWSDPRSECREGGAIIARALSQKE